MQTKERVDVTQSERSEVDDARDNFHRAVLNVLKNHGNPDIDLTEAGESIGLEGYFEV